MTIAAYKMYVQAVHPSRNIPPPQAARTFPHYHTRWLGCVNQSISQRFSPLQIQQLIRSETSEASLHSAPHKLSLLLVRTQLGHKHSSLATSNHSHTTATPPPPSFLLLSSLSLSSLTAAMSGLDERKDGGKGASDVMSLDDGGEEKKLKLVSQEGEKFEVSKKVAVQSELVKTMAEGDKDENEIPLPNVKASVLRKVVEYMKYHVDNPARDIEKPLKSANMAEVVSQWDAGQTQHRSDTHCTRL